MSNISSLLNLSNTDYQTSLFKRKKEYEEELLKADREKQRQEEIQAEQSTLQTRARETLRQINIIDQEIQQLSRDQAQKVMEMVTMRIAEVSDLQLTQIQPPLSKGLLPAAYV
jgi:hypothetical protein